MGVMRTIHAASHGTQNTFRTRCVLPQGRTIEIQPIDRARADLCLLVPRPVTGIRGRAKHDARTHQEICVLSTGMLPKVAVPSFEVQQRQNQGQGSRPTALGLPRSLAAGAGNASD